MVSYPPTSVPQAPSDLEGAPPSSASTSSDADDFDRQMSLANTILNSGSMRGGRNGDKSGFPSPFRSLTPRRIGLIAGGLLLVIFWFGKGTGTGRGVVAVGGGGADKATEGTYADLDLIADTPANPDLADVLPPSSPQKQALSSSSKCTPPPGQKARSYALMIDAGSTGSRLHLYTFAHCDPSPAALPKLEDEGFFPTKPGLSEFAGRPKEAAESLRGLLEHAMRGVPKDERSCTPIAVKATAGLRLLGETQSGEILREVERFIRDDWPFSLVQDGVVVMDGRDEGVYAWITINFLLGLIGHASADPTSSAAIMDLGGASTQIVFEPTFSQSGSEPAKLAPGDHVYDLAFAGAPHVLYQHSHLGYGLMQARRAVHNLVAFAHVWQTAPHAPVVWEDLGPGDKIHNPCMFAGKTKLVTLDPPGREKVQVTMVGSGRGFEACRRVVEVMLAKDAQCEEEPCAFAGVYQPSLGEVFSAGKVWALSYFYDRIAPLGLPSPFRISALRKLTSDVCAGPTSPTWSRFKGNAEAQAELADRPEYCLDLTFMYSLLSLGYELEEEREIWMGKKVGNVELGWALGAALNMVEGHLSCRAE